MKLICRVHQTPLWFADKQQRTTLPFQVTPKIQQFITSKKTPKTPINQHQNQEHKRKLSPSNKVYQIINNPIGNLASARCQRKFTVLRVHRVSFGKPTPISQSKKQYPASETLSNPSIPGSGTILLATNNRNQPALCGTLFIKIYIIRPAESCVQSYNQNRNHQSDQHISAHLSEHQRNDCDEPQRAEDNTIIKRLMKCHNGCVPVEEEKVPRDEECDKDDHGNGMPQEAKEEYGERNHRVVRAEMVEVALNPGDGFRVRVRAGERR